MFYFDTNTALSINAVMRRTLRMRYFDTHTAVVYMLYYIGEKNSPHLVERAIVAEGLLRVVLCVSTSAQGEVLLYEVRCAGVHSKAQQRRAEHVGRGCRAKPQAHCSVHC
jgi:hypothetical protein